MYRPRTKELFERVYDVLVKYAGASETMRENFVVKAVEWSEDDPYRTREFRFMGDLGMGGKVWLTPDSFHVSAYNEDLHARWKNRKKIIVDTNAELKKLFALPELEEKRA